MSRASRLRTGPFLTRDRQVGAAEPEGGNHGPREASSTKLQAGFDANQDFLGFWMVDFRREGHNQRSTPWKRHTEHLKRCTSCTPRRLSGRDKEGDKSQPSTGGDCARQAPGHLSCSDLGRAQNAGPTKSAPLWSTQEPEPEWLRPGNCMQPRPTSNSSWQSNLEPEQCRLGKHTCHERGPTLCGQDTASTPHTRQ